MDGLANPQYSYDGNGNLTCVSSGSACGGAVARQVTVTSFNMAASLTQGTTTLSLIYDDQHQRLIQARTSSGVTTTTFYVNDAASGSMSERRTDPTSSVPTFTDYITVDGQIVAQRNVQYAGSPAWTDTPTGCTPSTLSTCIPPLWGSFLWGNADATKVGMNQVWNGFAWGAMGFSPQAWGNFKWQPTGNPSGAPWSGTARISWSFFTLDNLGSVAVISDSGGNVVQRLSYDAWGKPRTPAGGILSCGTVGSSTTRGFTNQEEMPTQCLVNLNARLYDASIGKFLAADPMVGDPFVPNALNRYSYVLNNPLSFTDPTGLCFLGCFWNSDVFRAVIAIAAVLTVQTEVLAIEGVGGGTFTGAWTAGLASASTGQAITAAGVAGFTGGYIATGSFKGALLGGATAIGFYGVGQFVDSLESAGLSDVGGGAIRVGLHGLVGGISSAAAGGNFGSGFLAAGLGELAGDIGHTDSFVGHLIIGATAGGIGSVLGGGKFENGAVTGAFGYLFNDLASAWAGTQATYALAEQLNFRDGPGTWIVNRGSFWDVLLQGRADLVYENGETYEVKTMNCLNTASCSAAAEAQLQGYIEQSNGVLAIGSDWNAFEGRPGMFGYGQVFGVETTYWFQPSGKAGLIGYTIEGNRIEVLGEIWKAFRARKASPQLPGFGPPPSFGPTSIPYPP